MKANSLYYNCKIFAASSPKERYIQYYNSLAETKFIHLPTTRSPKTVLNFFLDKIIKIRRELDSQSVCPSSLPVEDPFDCTFRQMFLSLLLEVLSWSPPDTHTHKPAWSYSDPSFCGMSRYFPSFTRCSNQLFSVLWSLSSSFQNCSC